ncbi:MAG: hypothetical protein CME70_03535 [Halobacteriovorax sp.]|nr:hypothetical protein [Halobacteriovorax sp.]|tara:strand:- start:215857 stop:217242 length:1386 start_codon:yes stop_codon:yes gene_type:complete
MLKLFLVLTFFANLSIADEVQMNEDAQNRIAYFTVRQQTIIENNQKNFKRLLKRLKKDQIIGLELIVAASSKSRIQSRFGHTLLRFVDKLGSPGNDLVLSFVADLDGPRISNRRGVFGGYPVFPLLKKFREFNQDYIKNENRPLERHIIPSDSKMRSDLILVLSNAWNKLEENQTILDEKQILKAKERALKRAKKLKLSNKFKLLPILRSDSKFIVGWNLVDNNKIVHIEPVKLKVAFTDEFGKYKFLGNNCAGALVKLFKKSRFPSRGSLLFAGRMPIKIPTYFEKSLLSPFPKVTIEGLEPLKNKIRSLLSLKKNGTSDDFYQVEKWPSHAALTLSSKLSVLEKLKLLDAFLFLPTTIKAQLKRELPELAKRPTYDEIYELGAHPENLYNLCEDQSCGRRLRVLANKIWTKEDLELKKIKLGKLIKKIKENKLKKSLKLRPKVLKHFDFLFSPMQPIGQ